MFTLYNVISSDGFIAKEDGSEDFIPDSLWNDFLNLCKSYGVLVMGRNTYDAIQKYNKKLVESFESLAIKKIVVSADSNFSPRQGYVLVRSPKEAFETEQDALVSSGPSLNNFLLKEGMVSQIILYKVPVSIGNGIKPFDDIEMALIKENKRSDGITENFYSVK
jgi:dihydrofolate reductase